MRKGFEGFFQFANEDMRRYRIVQVRKEHGCGNRGRDRERKIGRDRERERKEQALPWSMFLSGSPVRSMPGNHGKIVAINHNSLVTAAN